MQTPICDTCLKSDSLCDICKTKLESNKINQNEIDVSRFIYNLSLKVKSLEDVSIEKVISAGNLIIISKIGDGSRLVGKGGTVVKVLAKKFGKSIRIIEKSDDYKKFIQMLILPSTLKAVNVLYSPTGEIYKLRIKNVDKTLPIKEEDICNISSSIFQKHVEIILEN